MWVPYLIFRTWLAGSLLLPFMAFLRWGATKWNGLHWLVQSRKRWLLIWGCFGFVNTIALAALLLGKFLPDYVPFDYLGWAWMPVRSVLDALHIPPEHVLSEFLLGLALKAIVDAAIDCGFASIVWWAYGWSTQEGRTPTKTTEAQRYVISFLTSSCALGIANEIHSWRPVTCWDCFWPHGIPFTFFHEGGFAGGAGFVWSGVIGDALVILLLAVFFGWVWNWRSRKHSTSNRIMI